MIEKMIKDILKERKERDLARKELSRYLERPQDYEIKMHGKTTGVIQRRGYKLRLKNLLVNLKKNTQIIILLESNKSEIISGNVKNIIKSQEFKNHIYDFVERIEQGHGHIVIAISLDK